jgi:hypothetical protein
MIIMIGYSLPFLLLDKLLLRPNLICVPPYPAGLAKLAIVSDFCGLFKKTNDPKFLCIKELRRIWFGGILWVGEDYCF